MKKLHSFLIALSAATILLPAAAPSFAAQQTDAAGAATADRSPASGKPVTAQDQTGDGKGASKPTPASQTNDDAKPAVDKDASAAAAPPKKPASKRKLRPHSHPQDGKGMYVPEKK